MSTLFQTAELPASMAANAFAAPTIGGTAKVAKDAKNGNPIPGWLRHVSQLPIGADPCPFTILIDTREQAPWRFDGFTTDRSSSGAAIRPLFVPARWHGLPTGDYSIETPEGESLADKIAIERKSLSDLYGTLGAGRERFTAEHERMAEIVKNGGYACVVVEASLEQAISEPPQESRLHPKVILRTATSWQVKYRVPWHFVGPRRLCEVFVFRLLEKWWEKKS